MQKTQERLRIEQGMQCPECSGVQTFCRYNSMTKQADAHKFECHECGCYWSKPLKELQ